MPAPSLFQYDLTGGCFMIEVTVTVRGGVVVDIEIKGVHEAIVKLMDYDCNPDGEPEEYPATIIEAN